MNRNIEFQLDSDGVIVKTSEGVHMFDEHADRELICEMKERIMNDYPDAYNALINFYQKSIANKTYFDYLIVRRFIKCNFMRSDKTTVDIDDEGNWHLEEPLCPMAGECEGYHVVCFCKMTNILTKREMTIISEYASGKQESEIAEELYISAKTVHNTITKAYKKINVRNRAQANQYVIQNNNK